MDGRSDLLTAMLAIAEGEVSVSVALAAHPGILQAGLDRDEECFIAEHHAQVYAGDTLLHVAAFAYNAVLVIRALIAAGADPNASAVGGVTPLHRAIRNRCSAAVQTLIELGADPHRTNDNGSTPLQLPQWTTGRSGSGSPEAKAEQQVIVRLLTASD